MSTFLNPDAIENGAILLSKVDSTVASKSYVDTAIDDIKVNYTTKTYVDGLVGDINSILESIING